MSPNYSHAAMVHAEPHHIKRYANLTLKRSRLTQWLNDMRAQEGAWINTWKAEYLLLVGAVPVDAVSLRSNEPGADAHDQARNPNQVHGGSEETRRAEE